MLLTASSKTAGSDLLLNHMTELPHVAWNQTKHITHTVSTNVTSAERGAALRAFKGVKGKRSKGKEQRVAREDRVRGQRAGSTGGELM